jgi:3-oxoacyl-[acyl-carrier-protein] synthase-3
MEGADVFNFVLREIPPDINRLLQFSNKQLTDFNFYVFHQANDYMNNYLAKKLKLDKEKVPTSIARFGNTSSVSIPLTIVSAMKPNIEQASQVLLCGFGVGMSWATAFLNLQHCKLSDLVEL